MKSPLSGSRFSAVRTAAVTAAVVAVGLVSLATPAAAAGSGVPFVDPNAHGYIAFCDLAGNNVTSGNIHSSPFVWKAVSSLPAPDDYSGKGQNAGLLAFQPRRGVNPGDWNGDQLTAASYYKSRKYPAVEATYKDFSLADFIHEFPSTWDGLYQLRMHFAKKNYGTYGTTYPAAVIQVIGNTWHVVQGGTLPCKAAPATSTELAFGIPLLDPKQSKSETPPTAPPSTQASPSSRSSNAASNVAGPDTGSGSTGGAHLITAPVSGQSAASSSSSSDAAVVALAALCGVLIVVLVGGMFWRRRGTGAMG